MKIFSPFRIFEQLALALKNRVCPENFHCIEYSFYHSGFLSNLRGLKNSVPRIHCIEYMFLIIRDFWATLRFPWETEFVLNPLCWIYVFHSRFLSNFALSLKNSVGPESFHRILNILFSFRIFEQLALALRNRVCPEMFHCIEYSFYHSGFLSNFALPFKNRVGPENFHCIEIFFIIQEFWATCACPKKQSLP